jgi:hypothetical protein
MQLDDGSWRNSIVELKKYFSTEGQAPLSTKEFQEFWNSLTEEEKEEFRVSELK